jgi:hypothetical protein
VFQTGAGLGGGYSASGVTTQTSTSQFTETVDLTQLAALHDLVVGFSHGDVLGTGVTGVTLNLYADGTDVVDETFSSAAAAQAYFTDDAVDLGSLATGPLAGSTLTLNAVLTVTSTSAGSGSYGDLIIGDPPAAAKQATATQAFVAAMADVGAGSSGSHLTVTGLRSLEHPVLAATGNVAAS